MSERPEVRPPNLPPLPVRFLGAADGILAMVASLRAGFSAVGSDGDDYLILIEESARKIARALGEEVERWSADPDSPTIGRELRHDLRNWIGAVTGFASLIPLECPLPGEAAATLDRIDAAARRLIAMLDEPTP